MIAATTMPRVVAIVAVFGMTLATRVGVTTEVESATKARENHRKAHEDIKLEARKPFKNDFDKLVSSASADLTRISQIDKSTTKKAGNTVDATSVLSLVQVTLANFQRR